MSHPVIRQHHQSYWLAGTGGSCVYCIPLILVITWTGLNVCTWNLWNLSLFLDRCRACLSQQQMNSSSECFYVAGCFTWHVLHCLSVILRSSADMQRCGLIKSILRKEIFTNITRTLSQCLRAPYFRRNTQCILAKHEFVPLKRYTGNWEYEDVISLTYHVLICQAH